MTPEQLADAILTAAGSSLRHYTPQSREAIIRAASQFFRRRLECKIWISELEIMGCASEADCDDLISLNLEAARGFIREEVVAEFMKRKGETK